MAKGRELKRRIKTVENTRKITRTMELVATSRMKRAQDRVQAARPYARALGDVIAGLYSPDLAERFPLLRQPAESRRAAVILLTSNRGLCGAFNANLIREARGLLARLRQSGIEVELHADEPSAAYSPSASTPTTSCSRARGLPSATRGACSCSDSEPGA